MRAIYYLDGHMAIPKALGKMLNKSYPFQGGAGIEFSFELESFSPASPFDIANAFVIKNSSDAVVQRCVFVKSDTSALERSYTGLPTTTTNYNMLGSVAVARTTIVPRGRSTSSGLAGVVEQQTGTQNGTTSQHRLIFRAGN